MGTVCRKQSQRKDEDYPGTCPCGPRRLLSPRPSLRLMPTTATATALVATTVATGPTALATVMDSTTARGRLRLSPRLMPTTDTDTALAATTVATGLTVLATATATVCTTARGRLRLSPTTATLPTLLPPLSTYAAAPVVS